MLNQEKNCCLSIKFIIVGWTPLHEACNHGWFEVANRLVQAGASVNARGLDDDTPLHDAASGGHQKLVKLLVENGADIHAKNKKGKSPVDVAAPRVLSILYGNSQINSVRGMFFSYFMLGNNISTLLMFISEIISTGLKPAYIFLNYL